ncbi:helix-turn-helix domain-containing protein [Dinoroseobacter sp. S375]|uniref:helix-turn-helix domain-containing protein n=1 Tax=Dinoroseobacter sp. S375 TaxID=3415136 RepID=UPI003C79D181
MSTLHKHIKSQGWNMTNAAAALGVSRPYLYGLLDETREPSLEVAQRIEQATGGAVPVSGWPKFKKVLRAASPHGEAPQ